MLATIGLWVVGVAADVDLTEAQRAAIEERIKPSGESCLQGDGACGGGAVAVVATGPRSGEEVYQAACAACHDSGVAGAPKYADAAGWVDRVAKGKAALYESGRNGLPGTGMIAKGGCVSCSDEEVDAAVDYMLVSIQ
ncbi:MAG: cytochrome c5 family protein [Halioglobus sp.]|nr:cytochrome c5 family protein [Halioglobus sp.]